MPYTVVFTPLAFSDYTEALVWFEDKSLQTRLNFEKVVTQRLSFIAEYPEAAPVEFKFLRAILLKKYQYKIYYRIFHNQNKIFIYAIAHTSRRTDFIKKRL